MKNSKAILLAIFTSAFAVLTVVNMSLASPKSAGENTLDMLEIMTRAFDENEGEGGGAGPGNYMIVTTYSDETGMSWEVTDVCAEGKVMRCMSHSGKRTVLCQPGGAYACSPVYEEPFSFTYCSACIDPDGCWPPCD